MAIRLINIFKVRTRIGHTKNRKEITQAKERVSFTSAEVCTFNFNLVNV